MVLDCMILSSCLRRSFGYTVAAHHTGGRCAHFRQGGLSVVRTPCLRSISCLRSRSQLCHGTKHASASNTSLFPRLLRPVHFRLHVFRFSPLFTLSSQRSSNQHLYLPRSQYSLVIMDPSQPPRQPGRPVVQARPVDMSEVRECSTFSRFVAADLADHPFSSSDLSNLSL